MMFPFTPDNSDSSDDSPAGFDMNELSVRLFTVGHAMTDYLRSDDSAMAAFARLCNGGEDPTDEQVSVARININGAHDVFATLAAQAEMRGMLAKFSAAVGSDSGSDDGDIDFGDFGGDLRSI